MIGGSLRAHLEAQAVACEMLGSPFTALICRLSAELLDETTDIGRLVNAWPGDLRADAVALRLCGALHYQALIDSDGPLATAYPPNAADVTMLRPALEAVLRANNPQLVQFLASPPQTNEVARSGSLLPGLLVVARESGLPLEIAEIGASGGLNLLLDRFHYQYGTAEWGDAGSPVRLAPELRGAAPPLDGTLTIVDREGCDIAPVDVCQQEARLRLQAYVWPDQALRLERLRGALALAETNPPGVVMSGAADFVRRKLGQRRDGAAFVLLHSIMWQYMPAQEQNLIKEMLEAAGRKSAATKPVYWLRMEPDDLRDGYPALRLTRWPGGETRDLAHCDFHVRWIEWLDGRTCAVK